MRFSSFSVAAISVLVIASSYSGPASGRSSSGATDAHVDTTTTTRRPAGPSADVSDEITGGNGAFVGESTPPDLKTVGYVEHEFVAAGTATDYQATGELTPDGRWTFEPDTSAAYRTRILVRRPAKAADFSGTVVVEWMNVSGGVDANPDYANLSEEITRHGDAWVGVTAQLIGVNGGPVLVTTPGNEGVQGKGLKALDPARYGSLEHPGDGYSFDIYTQVARALRKRGAALGGRKAKQVLAAGESQSAVALTTYYNGVQPLTQAFDGFFVHSRAFATLPLVAPGEYADLAGSIGTSTTAIFRTDLDAPVLELQVEGDVTGVLNSAAARQSDTDRFRLWEVAGNSHADVRLIGEELNDLLDCGAPINNGPMHFVAKAAFRALDTWVRTGQAPPKAPRLELTDEDPPQIRRDTDGIAVGGIRTPLVDVPVDVLSGASPPNPDLICMLLGSTTPLSADRLAELYPSRAAYTRRYNAAVDKAIEAGFVLEADRKALLAYAEPKRVKG